MTTLEKINSLQYYDGLKKVKEVLKSIFSSITSLETNSVIVGKVSLKTKEVVAGTPLIVGKKYSVSIDGTDNFTNVGFISDNTTFLATGATPTLWTTSSVRELDSQLSVNFNDVDNNVQLDWTRAGGNPRYLLKITNNKFIESKVFPYLESGSVSFLDNNTLEFSTGTESFIYFKIEIYN